MNKEHMILDALRPGQDLAIRLDVTPSAISKWRVRGIPPTQKKLLWALFRRRLNKAGIYEDEPESQPAEGCSGVAR